MWVAVRGTVYNMGEGRNFYGPGGPYAVFAGRRVARALAKLSTDAAECTDDTEGLSATEMQTLADWEDKFKAKYDVIGYLPEGAPLRV